MDVLTEDHEDQDGRDQKHDPPAPATAAKNWRAARQMSAPSNVTTSAPSQPYANDETVKETVVEQEDDGILVIEQLRTNAKQHVEVEQGEQPDDMRDD